MRGKILIIEDNDDDVVMIERGLRKGKIDNEWIRVRNGKEAFEFLEKNTDVYIEFILLDLNMEVMNGFEVLKIRSEIDKYKQIPVIVLTSSQRDNDIEKSYKLGANAYVSKPIEAKEFIEAVTGIEDFWIRLVKKV